MIGKNKTTSVSAKAIPAKKAIPQTLIVFSRHPSHDVLRKSKLRVPTSVCIRFGSTTESKCRVQLNSIESVQRSSDKRLMKMSFLTAGVKSPKTAFFVENFSFAKKEKEIIFWKDEIEGETLELNFPIVLKHRFGSRGEGNTLFQTIEEFKAYCTRNTGKQWQNYIIEEFVNYSFEYRIHVATALNEGFYACRKALKADVGEDAKWFRNDSNCVWFMEDNVEQFKKPANWNEIVADAILAAKSVGLDTAAIDVRVKSKPNAQGAQDWVIIETNSAPSFGDVTFQKYLEVIPRIITARLA
jgi:glutathione synthase/RimK-type ligase-like ATP-grasp enzyme